MITLSDGKQIPETAEECRKRLNELDDALEHPKDDTDYKSIANELCHIANRINIMWRAGI